MMYSVLLVALFAGASNAQTLTVDGDCTGLDLLFLTDDFECECNFVTPGVTYTGTAACSGEVCGDEYCSDVEYEVVVDSVAGPSAEFSATYEVCISPDPAVFPFGDICASGDVCGSGAGTAEICSCTAEITGASTDGITCPCSPCENGAGIVVSCPNFDDLELCVEGPDLNEATVFPAAP